MPLWSYAGRLCVASICAVSVLAAPRALASPPASVRVIATATGRVSGIVIRGSASEPGMQAYLGIPYAAPPVGALRWTPPQPHAAWPGIRAAAAFGNHCPQPPSPLGIASVTEDCLYLNVFVPRGTDAGAKLPVMVWIHGGDFIGGESDDYDPQRLVAHGVIVVTLNYRLGYLGFLATPGLDAEPHLHNNFGLLDQRAALAWTRANIAAFGGDPVRTVIFGESAGGASTFAHVLSPLSAGLFSGAIVQSGAYDILSLPSLTQAETTGDEFAAAVTCGPADTACLRALPVAQILALEGSAGSPLGGGPSPAIDGTFLPDPVQTALSAGRFNRVPIVQGTNRDEFRFFTATLFDLAGGPLNAGDYPFTVQETLAVGGLGADSRPVLAQYPAAKYASADVAYSALTTDAVFATPAYVTDALLSAKTCLYAYEFADENAPEDFLPPVTFAYGAAHASELQFLFDFFGHAPHALLPGESVLAAQMADYWTRFAATSTPNAFSEPLWMPFAIHDDVQWLAPGATGPFFGFAAEHNAAFWAGLSANAPGSTIAAGRRYVTLRAAAAAARTLRAAGAPATRPG